MALNRSDKSRILRRYFPGMTRNSEMSTEPRNVMPQSSVPIPCSGKQRRTATRTTQTDRVAGLLAWTLSLNNDK